MHVVETAMWSDSKLKLFNKQTVFVEPSDDYLETLLTLSISAPMIFSERTRKINYDYPLFTPNFANA